jgi:hypothetical protein
VLEISANGQLAQFFLIEAFYLLQRPGTIGAIGDEFHGCSAGKCELRNKVSEGSFGFISSFQFSRSHSALKIMQHQTFDSMGSPRAGI